MAWEQKKPLYRPRYPVQALEKALDIIELLSSLKSDKGLGVSEINERLGIGKSTVHRLLDTLVAYEYVERMESNRYRLGWGMFEIGSALPRQRKVGSVESNILKQVSNSINETVNLGVRSGTDVVIVEKRNPEQLSRIRVDFEVGEREPFHATAMGKLFFSELDEGVKEELLRGYHYERLTEHTIKTHEAMMEELEKVKNQGYAEDREEFSPGIYSVGMPVRGHRGDIVAVISVRGPAFRFDQEKIKQVLKELTKATEELSTHLGYRE